MSSILSIYLVCNLDVLIYLKNGAECIGGVLLNIILNILFWTGELYQYSRLENYPILYCIA